MVHAGRDQRPVQQWVTHAAALPYARYGWVQRLLMKRVVAKAGGDTDTHRDCEYTDWNDVWHFAANFGLSLPAST